MSYTGETIIANIGGEKHRRKIFKKRVDGEVFSLISIHGKEYLVFRRDGRPVSVYGLKEYLAIA